jgi:Tfp pilus assembly protein PilF
MKSCSYRLIGLTLFGFLLLIPGALATAQESQDNQPHIQPRTTPTPTPSPTPSPTPAAGQPSQKPQDQYERPPFPGDTGDTNPMRPNAPSPKRKDEYERPPFPGDAPGTRATGGNATGESSSKDSQINLNGNPTREEPVPAAEDPAVLQPWDPHKAAKDVEVGQYYLKLKNYRAALERFNHALTYKPDNAEAIYGLAVTQEKLDLLSLADTNYRKYLGILPNGPKSKEAEAALKRIAPNVAMRKPGDAGADPSKLAAHDIDVGETYLSGNNFDAARERFEDAMRVTPDNPLIWFRLAQALQGMQRLDPARLYYRKYLEAQPKGKFAGNAKKAISQIDWILGKGQ